MVTQTWAADAGTDPADVPQQRDAAADGISARREKILLQLLFFFLNIMGNMSRVLYKGSQTKKWHF